MRNPAPEKDQSQTVAIIREMLPAIWSGEVRWDCPLAGLSTLRVGGPATAIVYPGTVAELTGLIRGLRRRSLPWRVIGRGSNILVADRGLAEVVIVSSSMAAVARVAAGNDHRFVRAEAGCSLPRLVAWGTKEGLSGLEFAVGIPGSVGGAIVMNAGAWGQEISGCLDSIVVLDDEGEIKTLPASTEPFSYRSWGNAAGKVVLSATFRLAPGAKAEIAARVEEYRRSRQKKQPRAAASAGSFFKNPPEAAAGWLIEQAGLKGTRCGGAVVSPDHANFLVNEGGATARDFVALMQLVQERVWHRSGIRLQPEVQLLGFEENAR